MSDETARPSAEGATRNAHRPARYLRQVLLSEIGASGQQRIEAATARVGGPKLSHEIASAYARGAGFSAVSDGVIDEDALAPESFCVDRSARAVLSGSRAAVAAIVAALELAR